MASSKEAFRKLGNWKKSKTVLKVTVLTKGDPPETLTGLIMGVDEFTMQVALGLLPSRNFVAFDLTDVTFSLGRLLLEARRSPDEILSFADTGEIYRGIDTKKSPR